MGVCCFSVARMSSQQNFSGLLKDAPSFSKRQKKHSKQNDAVATEKSKDHPLSKPADQKEQRGTKRKTPEEPEEVNLPSKKRVRKTVSPTSKVRTSKKQREKTSDKPSKSKTRHEKTKTKRVKKNTSKSDKKSQKNKQKRTKAATKTTQRPTSTKSSSPQPEVSQPITQQLLAATDPLPQPQTSCTDIADPNSIPSQPKRGRPRKGEVRSKKKKYIKKGQPGYVRPKYNYIPKGRKYSEMKFRMEVHLKKAAEYREIISQHIETRGNEFLFDKWMPKLSSVQFVEDPKEYLPSSHRSPFFCFRRNATVGECSSPETLALFECKVQRHHVESEDRNDDLVVNVGGPIWALDWCPFVTTALGYFMSLALSLS